MSQSNENERYGLSDKRNSRNRFRWVRRLVQGQHKQPEGSENGYRVGPHSGQHGEQHAGGNSMKSGMSKDTTGSYRSDELYESDNLSSTMEIRSNGELSTTDNISTTPLKSIVSRQSTKSPSVLSNSNQDQTSFVASTAETSITPSSQTNLAPPNTNPQHVVLLSSDRDRERDRDRDSESIVTLASSSRRTRRRSIDTNCSTTGIPPASIMERLTVQPTAGASSCAVSVRTSNERPEAPSTTDTSISEQVSSTHDATITNKVEDQD